eukprot:TRINITY_DN10828_c0_g1_i1.p1 TRINITY_DN10828_c0_g1~~TRINITY_DN10828_c0_g1_i1.p1  ORF type:complete len:318 (-),score=83.29 TRINITY_DN10828_c0_g1_i1:251-1087(-)
MLRSLVGSEMCIRDSHNTVPGLAVVLVGERKDSQAYVKMKKRACAQAGFHSVDSTLSEDISQDELVRIVRQHNADPKVHGILVQLPLPDHIDEEFVLDQISIEKDVDGFHTVNVGRLNKKGTPPSSIACTPWGCVKLLERSGVQIEGANAVVVGRSNIVGMPAARLLQDRNATVTVCHSRTKDLPAAVSQADIVIAAIGRAEMIKGDWIKPGAVVIDVGINAVDDPSDKRGYRLVGDVAFDEAKEVASQITPVPGGVGPMTIAMLLSNTLDSAKASLK